MPMQQNVFYGSAVPFAMPQDLKNCFSSNRKVTAIYSEGNDQMRFLDNNGHAAKKFKEEKGVFFTDAVIL